MGAWLFEGEGLEGDAKGILGPGKLGEGYRQRLINENTGCNASTKTIFKKKGVLFLGDIELFVIACWWSYSGL